MPFLSTSYLRSCFDFSGCNGSGACESHAKSAEEDLEACPISSLGSESVLRQPLSAMLSNWFTLEAPDSPPKGLILSVKLSVRQRELPLSLKAGGGDHVASLRETITPATSNSTYLTPSNPFPEVQASPFSTTPQNKTARIRPGVKQPCNGSEPPPTRRQHLVGTQCDTNLSIQRKMQYFQKQISHNETSVQPSAGQP